MIPCNIKLRSPLKSRLLFSWWCSVSARRSGHDRLFIKEFQAYETPNNQDDETAKVVSASLDALAKKIKNSVDTVGGRNQFVQESQEKMKLEDP